MAAAFIQRTTLRRLAVCRGYASVRNVKPPTQDAISSQDLSQENAAAASGNSDKLNLRPENRNSAESLAARYLDMPGSSSSLTPGSPAPRSQFKGKRSLSSIERKRQTMLRAFMTLGLLGSLYGAWQYSEEWVDDYERQRLGKLARDYLGVTTEAEMEQVPAYKQRWTRLYIRATDFLDYFNKPAWEPLIPPPLPPTHQRPYTLVIELEDILVHSEWTRDHGWRTAKRPGIEDFLGYLSQFYEIVVFTEAPSYTAMPVLDKIDPLQYYFVYRLFRDSTRFTDGKIVKDLSYLGRDLSKVIQIDISEQAISPQPGNAILVPAWNGDKRDSRLLEFLPFLEAIAINNVADVRPLLKAYEGKDIPKEFAARQAEYKRKHIAEWEARKPSTVSPIRLFGINSAKLLDEPPPTFFEEERERYLEHYKQESKFFKDNESTMLSQMEADREKQMKDFFGMLGSLGQQPPPVKSPEDQKVIDSAR